MGSGCGVCESVCAYGASKITTKDGQRVSEVNKALCKGCGTCAVACPSKAIQQLGFKPHQLFSMANASLE